ncbi:helix-turn-helix domain-containing protein [Bacillus sp. FJAT-29937]|uniref:helix-turn-helix domain-containing protein n=1 Tax=Bacillus sp. FJAT-29937 TaxID=1720553 RepID=UPI0008357B39|nr:helix-turn-helix transcriptional regulator [Bacillus sp. FJAT-29937]
MNNWTLAYIGTTVRRLRKSRMKSQEALASESSLDRRTIGKIENDQVIPKFTTFNSLACAFEMDPLELLEEVKKDIRRARMRKKEFE